MDRRIIRGQLRARGQVYDHFAVVDAFRAQPIVPALSLAIVASSCCYSRSLAPRSASRVLGSTVGRDDFSVPDPGARRPVRPVPESCSPRRPGSHPRRGRWLRRPFAPHRLVDTIGQLHSAQRSERVEGEREDDGVRDLVAACDERLARYRAVADAGGDPATAAGWIADVNAQRAAAVASIPGAQDRGCLLPELPCGASVTTRTSRPT